MATVKQIENFIMAHCTRIKNEGITYSEAGSIKHLMFGSEPSEQSLSIKMGRVGEEMIKEIINKTPDFTASYVWCSMH